MDLAAFVARQLELLQQERTAELEHVQRLQRECSPGELEARGELLRRLQVADLEPALGGRVLAVLQPAREGGLGEHRFGPGDVVALQPSGGGDEIGSGVVQRADARELRVVLDDDDCDLPPLVQVARLFPDVTWRRLKQALLDLPQAATSRDAPAQRLIAVCFGTREPEFAAPRPLQPFDATLDDSQRDAIAHALAAQDLALIHGPPGTGKTTAIVELIRQCVARGERVLAAAPSNVAVDNLAERLLACGLRIVRIGQPVRVLPAVASHTLPALVADAPEQRLLRDLRRELHDQQRRLARADRATRRAHRDELRRLRQEQRQLEGAIVAGLLDDAQVVLATTTGAADAVLGDRVFDLAVLDEAAQALEAAAWLPLLRARRAVLAGDHWQLPPTVISPRAAAQGLATTLFERLVLGPSGPRCSRRLLVQYRMHEAIQSWSSQRFYGGALTPAPAVRAHLLAGLPGIAADSWTALPLLFVDTAGAGCEETAGDEEGSKENPGEADYAERHVRGLLLAGVPPHAIAVLSPYRAQVRALRLRLADVPDLEVGTIDGLQGREKEAVVLSLVRSNDRGEVGFLAELRRLNVALTRARRHLCIVGDSATLACEPELEALVAHWQAHAEHRSLFELR